MTAKKKRVVVAMSGGVDSSTAACLLVREGYDVIGVTMKLFDEKGDAFSDESSCCGIKGVADARKVCDTLEIPYYVLNFKAPFEKEVIDYFCREYSEARTPNPCIVCNEKMKWGWLLERAKTFEADFFATGHYARTGFDEKSKRYLLQKGVDEKKQQTYFLYSLTQDQLKYTLFPLGNMTKEQVRQKAKEFGLKVHDKQGSQEICFVPDDDYKGFIAQHSPDTAKPGKIVDGKGNVLGEHKGLPFYTIGQRKGLGLSAKRPLYVADMDRENNTLIVGFEEELYSNGLIASRLNWISIEGLDSSLKISAAIRYNHIPVPATIFPDKKGKVKVLFDSPQKAVTPGQAVVFYDGETVVGGGVIDSPVSKG